MSMSALACWPSSCIAHMHKNASQHTPSHAHANTEPRAQSPYLGHFVGSWLVQSGRAKGDPPGALGRMPKSKMEIWSW